MQKKILLSLIIFFLSITSLYSSNHKIHLKGFVPETYQIIIDTENINNQIIINNNLAYYHLIDKKGELTNINNCYYLKVFMI